MYLAPDSDAINVPSQALSCFNTVMFDTVMFNTVMFDTVISVILLCLAVSGLLLGYLTLS